MAQITILPAETAPDINDIRHLIQHYANWLATDHDISLEFQNIDTELAGLPGKYAAPDGALLVARDKAGSAVGCAAFRPLHDGRCEMKRLYALPSVRGQGLGKRLADRLITQAQACGYAEMVLDTAGFMTGAQKLYRQLGFLPIEAYCYNPVEGAQYLGLML